jgi:hypothetical protein
MPIVSVDRFITAIIGIVCVIFALAAPRVNYGSLV